MNSIGELIYSQINLNSAALVPLDEENRVVFDFCML